MVKRLKAGDKPIRLRITSEKSNSINRFTFNLQQLHTPQ